MDGDEYESLKRKAKKKIYSLWCVMKGEQSREREGGRQSMIHLTRRTKLMIYKIWFNHRIMKMPPFLYTSQITTEKMYEIVLHTYICNTYLQNRKLPTFIVTSKRGRDDEVKLCQLRHQPILWIISALFFMDQSNSFQFFVWAITLFFVGYFFEENAQT